MSTDALRELRKALQKQLKAEAVAKGMYSKYIRILKDKEIVQVLGYIRNDEKEHIRIVKRMIEMLGGS
jgi:rubrerythrin